MLKLVTWVGICLFVLAYGVIFGGAVYLTGEYATELREEKTGDTVKDFINKELFSSQNELVKLHAAGLSMTLGVAWPAVAVAPRAYRVLPVAGFLTYRPEVHFLSEPGQGLAPTL